ncbi:MAG TPA: four helix bundle protein [Candidatus Angelobacter sp.]|nr:four helix bundle protein [Candidatus Angelobacter sp.]
MNERTQQLLERTKSFALRIIRLFRSLPRTPEVQIIEKQLLRSGTSVGAIIGLLTEEDHGLNLRPSSEWFLKKLMKQFIGLSC